MEVGKILININRERENEEGRERERGDRRRRRRKGRNGKREVQKEKKGHLEYFLTLLNLSFLPKPSMTSICSNQVNIFPNFKGAMTIFLDTTIQLWLLMNPCFSLVHIWVINLSLSHFLTIRSIVIQAPFNTCLLHLHILSSFLYIVVLFQTQNLVTKSNNWCFF